MRVWSRHGVHAVWRSSKLAVSASAGQGGVASWGGILHGAPWITHGGAVLLHGRSPQTLSVRVFSSNGVPDSVRGPDGELLLKPVEPAPEECCGRGCENCVWNDYWAQLQAYEAAVKRSRGEEVALDPLEALERRLAGK